LPFRLARGLTAGVHWLDGHRLLPIQVTEQSIEQ